MTQQCLYLFPLSSEDSIPTFLSQDNVQNSQDVPETAERLST